MKQPRATKIVGRHRRAGVAKRDTALARRLAILPLAAIAALTLASGAVLGDALANPEPASAHGVMKRVGRPQRVCTAETRQVQVIVGYEGVGRLRRPVYAWEAQTREFCEWKNVVSYVPRPHMHVSDEVCTYVEVFMVGSGAYYGGKAGAAAGAGSGGSAPGAVAGGAVGAGLGASGGYWVSQRVCNWIPSVIWLG
ncbi:MAG: hypothetical protein OXF75_12445 [Acidimicrobiaceae bacterium]|nr:hypothetical protein [Acidimicrobiaceae bacterium]